MHERYTFSSFYLSQLMIIKFYYQKRNIFTLKHFFYEIRYKISSIFQIKKMTLIIFHNVLNQHI